MKKTIIKGFERFVVQNPNDVDLPDQTMYRFDNNRGASIVFHYGSYGYEQGLLELAVATWSKDGKEWFIDYSTDITRDVVGYLNEQQASELLQRISEM
ncbi:hypothetical protein [Leuconostoc mesenteroides]|uniref:hypothetical protein n=1 Tax=Leuconostoc mesenteroides TaxID=1245 RepID=UPI0023622FDE|nr:hypothetical protein [Leuconostoc mesenteroides]